MALFLFGTFINIYSIDEYEYKNNLQTYFVFKRKMFFIFSYKKSKTIVSKKTFILECLGYFVALIVIATFVFSLWLSATNFLILFWVLLLCIVGPYCSVVAAMYHKTRRLEKKNFKIDYGDDDEDE